MKTPGDAPEYAESGTFIVPCNVTAVFSIHQVREIAAALAPGVPAIISIFAGRIADTGRDPIPHMREAVRIAADKPDIEILWASPRETLNIFHANDSGCHIITVTPDLLAKLSGIGKDLEDFSRETVEMFYRDAQSSGFSLLAGPARKRKRAALATAQ